jgi:hypothetical protein
MVKFGLEREKNVILTCCLNSAHGEMGLGLLFAALGRVFRVIIVSRSQAEQTLKRISTSDLRVCGT